MKKQLQKSVNKDIEITINGVVKCSFCGKFEAEIPIIDSETLKEIHICRVCDNDLYWKNELTSEQEEYIIESQIEKMREEKYLD